MQHSLLQDRVRVEGPAAAGGRHQRLSVYHARLARSMHAEGARERDERETERERERHRERARERENKKRRTGEAGDEA